MKFNHSNFGCWKFTVYMFKLGLDLFFSLTEVSWEVENLMIKICTKSISYLCRGYPNPNLNFHNCCDHSNSLEVFYFKVANPQFFSGSDIRTYLLAPRQPEKHLHRQPSAADRRSNLPHRHPTPNPLLWILKDNFLVNIMQQFSHNL